MTRFYPVANRGSGLKSYSANFVWAASSARTYLVISGAAPGGTTTTTTPTAQTQLPFFDVPEYCDMFGLEVTATIVSGTPPAASWVTAKMEVWAETLGGGAIVVPGTTAPALRIDGNPGQHPPIIYCDAALAANRSSVDVIGGDSNIPATTYFAALGTPIVGSKLTYTYWLSSMPPNGPQRVCNYDQIMALLSFDPTDAALTFNMAITVRPVGVNMGGRDMGGQ